MAIHDYDETLMRITAQYVDEYEAGLQPRIGDYIGRYPRYANEIADFVAYYYAVEEADKPRTAPAFIPESLLTQLQQLGASTPAAMTLLCRSDRQPVSQSWLAAQLQLSEDIIHLLETRAINGSTVPAALYLRLASILQYAVDDIQWYIGNPVSRQDRSTPVQKVAEANEPYGEEAMMNKGISFQQALAESTQLSEEQRQCWLDIVEQEDL
jgi:hypothetical protein